MHGSPDRWARRVVAAYHKHSGDKVIGEVNMGGDLIAATIHNVDSTIPFKAVRATRGKVIRAEPASALVEQGRVHFVGIFGQLEDQLTDWTPESSGSPDRMDAFVWALHELSQSGGWEGGWVAEATAIFKETGRNPLAAATSKPSTAETLGEAQMKTQAQSGGTPFLRDKTFGGLRGPTMPNDHVRDPRSAQGPLECPQCHSKALARYSDLVTSVCGWNSNAVVRPTTPA